MQFKTGIISAIFHLIVFPGHGWPWVTETTESKIANKGGSAYVYSHCIFIENAWWDQLGVAKTAAALEKAIKCIGVWVQHTLWDPWQAHIPFLTCEMEESGFFMDLQLNK